MTRMIALLLAVVMLLSLSGCGGSVREETAQASAGDGVPVPETSESPVPEETVAPTTEPTLSHEEMLYNSLPERMRQAVDAGIVELNQLEDLERTVTVGEASQMLQKAYVHRTGVESKTLNDLINREEFASRTADRGWIAAIPGFADLEIPYGENFESYEQWGLYLGKQWASTGDLWSGFDNRLCIHMPVLGVLDSWDYRYDADSETFYSEPFGSLILNATDYAQFWEEVQQDPLYFRADDRYSYGLKVYDSTNGGKFISLENGSFHGRKELTVEEAAQCALVYYNFPNPMAYPTYVAPAEVGAYNPEIITPELLSKETDLPAASCERLPSQWHGVVLDDMEMNAYNMHTDPEIYEYEIRKIKEAGFNFVGLNLDFSWLQDYWLFNTRNNGGKNGYVSLINKEDDGKISLERLEKLDRVIALCMEYDIHVNLRATALGKISGYSLDMGQKIVKGSNYAGELAELWQAIARRYADIPNEYLSFTLFTAANYDVKNEMLVDSVEAIRAVSPDRCIIADICTDLMDSEEFAKLGVALSYRLRDSEKYGTIFNMNAYYKKSSRSSEMRLYWLTNQGKTVIETFDWPYQGEMDADVLFSSARKKGENLTDVMETAREYGVGFMLSDFGVAVHQEEKGVDYAVSRLRYADEPYFAMITDITSTMEELGYGWCFAHWYNPYGIAFCLPAIKTSAYEQIEDYPYYIDQGMFELFKSVNGVQ